MKTYLDRKTKTIVKIVYSRNEGKIQCRCIYSGIFMWRDSIKELVPVEYWMLA
jgi:hypothetical protein